MPCPYRQDERNSIFRKKGMMSLRPAVRPPSGGNRSSHLSTEIDGPLFPKMLSERRTQGKNRYIELLQSLRDRDHIELNNSPIEHLAVKSDSKPPSRSHNDADSPIYECSLCEPCTRCVCDRFLCHSCGAEPPEFGRAGPWLGRISVGGILGKHF